MITKIISGFQTGADIGAIRAAKDCGLETGGFMPRAYYTESGTRPEYDDLYGAIALPTSGYANRTARNAAAAEYTFWFGHINTPGYRCTFRACRGHGKTFIHVADNGNFSAAYHVILDRIRDASCINVAGNRESTNHGIEEFTYNYIKGLIEYQRLNNPVVP